MFIGQYYHNLENKGRVSLPKKFREELGEEMILAKWYEGCLVLVSRQNWQDLIKRLTGEGRIITSPVRDIDRFILASAFEVSLDGQGRFVLPESLIDYASFENDLIFVGLGERVEIWQLARWRDLEKLSEEKAAKAIEKIAKREK